MFTINSAFKIALLAVVASVPATVFAQAAQVQAKGFTQPFRQVELASDESGSISQLLVVEGQSVTKGEVLAHLDNRVQVLQVESAQHLVDSKSALEAARRTLEKRRVIAGRIRELISTGHATDSELIRADLEQSIANARYVAAEEDAIGREIDLRRAQLLLERRAIKSPFDGVVAKLHRQEGEFLSPLRPEVVTLIQIDQLLAVFPVMANEVKYLEQGAKVTISFQNEDKVTGTIYSIDVQTDAESSTVRVKVLLDNSNGKLRSGEECFLGV